MIICNNDVCIHAHDVLSFVCGLFYVHACDCTAVREGARDGGEGGGGGAEKEHVHARSSMIANLDLNLCAAFLYLSSRSSVRKIR